MNSFPYALRSRWLRIKLRCDVSTELEGLGLKRFPEQVPRERGSHRLF
jgi:hypothetical protein